MSTPMRKGSFQWFQWAWWAAIATIAVVVSRLERIGDGLGLVFVLLLLVGMWRFLKRRERKR